MSLEDINIGPAILEHVTRTGELRPFTDAGLTSAWLDDTDDHSAGAIFDDNAAAAWRYILGYHERHRKAPDPEMFERSFPALPLFPRHYIAGELIEAALEQIRSSQVREAVAKANVLNAEGDTVGAGRVLEAAAARLRHFKGVPNITAVWDTDVDVDTRLKRSVPKGIFTGIKQLDRQFAGFQAGNLITYLGRAKAGKTSFLLLSAFEAWREGNRVLFLSVEIAASVIEDKLDALAAQLDVKHLQAGKLLPEEERRFRAARADMAEWEDSFIVVQPRAGGYTVTELADDIERYSPDVVYVDGFYFLTDRITRKSGGNWEGHDNLAREMKELAMDTRVCILTSMQVREKQLKAKGLDDGAMMGGTGLTMASDMVLGFDSDEEHVHTISCTRSRTGYLSGVKGTWDWEVSTFEVSLDEAAEDREYDGALNTRAHP